MTSIMRENRRKCCKCGSSILKNPTIKLYRFPRPGVRNLLKCELWAKFIAPEGAWSSQDFQIKLNMEHNMLCSLHFEEKCFINMSEKKLFLDAVPTIEITEMSTIEIENRSDVLIDYTNISVPSTSRQATTVTETHNMTSAMEVEERSNVLQDLTNLSSPSTSRQSTTVKETQDVRSTMEFPTMVTNPSVPSTSRQATNTKDTQDKSSSASDAKTRRLYTQCRKYLKKICRLKNSIKKMKAKDSLTLLSDDANVAKLSKKLTPTFALLLQGQIRNFNRKPKGHRWTESEKITALRIYKRSPTCYRLLRRLFTLPAPSTLKKILSQFHLTVGINRRVFELLRRFVQTLKSEDNHFVLMFDEISIRKNLFYNVKEDLIEGFQDHANHGRSREEATHALVFMIAEIRKPVKQPIAFYLSGSHVTADRLAVIIKEVVLECLQSGINIQSLVCDMDGVNVRAYKILGATESKPLIEINDVEIITMFDTPHLLKCFRNLFLKYNLKCPMDINSPNDTMGIAKWSHIEEFYKVDSINPVFVYAPALSTYHLNPNSKQKMKVSLAAQTLSHSVASGMYGRIGQGTLSTEALVTANVVSNIDKLFDLVNSSTPDLKRGKPYCTNISNTSPHKDFFKKMKYFFTHIEFINCKRDPPSRLGWIWTLTAIEILWQKIQSSNIKSMSTRRLQQDPLENFFSVVRSNCGSNSNPTVGQFKAAMKTSMLAKLPIIGSGNCEKDSNEMIIDNFKKLLSGNLPSQIQEDTYVGEESSSSFINTDEIEQNIDLSATAYVCGFIIKNNPQTCAACKEIFLAKEEEDFHLFMSFKEYSETHKALQYASRPLVQNVDECSRIIKTFIDTNGHELNIRKRVFELLKGSVSFDYLTCEEHAPDNINYIIKSVFHIVIKRHCIIKNRTYAEQATKIALKNKINILKHV